jgi:hypothetical protein
MKKLGDSGLKPLVILATISTIYTARKKATQEMSACYYVRANLTKVTYKQMKRDIITKTH